MMHQVTKYFEDGRYPRKFDEKKISFYEKYIKNYQNMFVSNEIEKSLNYGEIPISDSHEDLLNDINSFDLSMFLDNNEVENSEEFKNVSIEIDEILSGLDKSEVKSIGYYVLLILHIIIIFIGASGNVTVFFVLFSN